MKTHEFNRVRNRYNAIEVSPMPSEAELAAFYKDTYYQDSSSDTYSTQYPDDELEQRRLRAELLAFALEKAGMDARQGKTLLEIGCGEGFVLQAAKEHGYDVQGIDFSDFGVRTFHPHLLQNIETGDGLQILNKLEAQNVCFDVCVMQNILEHVIDPESLLKKVHRILSPGGRAVVTVPNDFSRLQEWFVEQGYVDKEYWFLPPEHLHYFNVDSVRKFVDHCGFSVINAFADFPIELFLMHPGANYVCDPAQGKGAHRARISLDLLLAERGLDNYYAFCQAVSACGMGRNVTVILTPKDS